MTSVLLGHFREVPRIVRERYDVIHSEIFLRFHKRRHARPIGLRRKTIWCFSCNDVLEIERAIDHLQRLWRNGWQWA